MATKLDDLKFNDYTLKGTQSGAVTSYTLGSTDRLADENGNGILWYDSGSSHGWIFHGLSDQAQSVGSIGGSALYYNSGSSRWEYVAAPAAIGCSSSIKLRATNDGSSSYIKMLSPMGSDFCIGYTSGGSSYFMGGVSQLILDVASGGVKVYDLSVDSNGFVKASLR